MDESFAMPGGGFVNLDLYERMLSSPGVNLVTFLGEASFHQAHGGTTTNLANHDERRELIRSYEDHYEELRGRRFRVPNQRAHYLGSLPPARTAHEARGAWAPSNFARAHRPGPTSLPAAEPMPDELRTEFIDAFWRSG